MIRRSRAPALILIGVLIAALAPAPLAAREEEQPASNSYIGFAGVGATLCTLVYSPVKIAYAASGLLVGAIAWAWSFGNSYVARPIFTAALRGDYVVTPQHLSGERDLEFVGRRY